MTDFIMNNIDTIGTLVISLIMVVWALYTRKWTTLQLAAVKLMFSVEKIAETKEGTAKMDEVFEAIWAKLPKWIKKFVTEKTLREKLQDWYNIAKNSLGGDQDSSTTTSDT